MEFHLISNGKMEITTFAQEAGRLSSYVDFIHIREKHRTAHELRRSINFLSYERVPKAQLIVNDRVDVAYVDGVGGVQLPGHGLDARTVREYFPHLRIGRSVHAGWEAQEAEACGADYVLFGHIFSSQSKPELEPRGVEALRKVVMEVSIPVIAIGGITPDNVHEIRDAGASGIAVMSGVWEATDPIQMIHDYQKGWKR